MILPLLIAVQAAPAALSGPATPSAAARYAACEAQVDADPAAAAATATKWAADGGGVPAAQCLGLARAAREEWRAATDAFVAGADIAEQTGDGRAATMLVSAGNAALAGGEPARARDLLTRAIAVPSLPAAMKGEAYLDRARAWVAEEKPADARPDLDQTLALVPADPMAWLLSATLARRMGDLPRATTDIAEADGRAANEPAILLERGRIAQAGGDLPAARAAWAKARAADPASDAAIAARRLLADTGGVPALPQAQGR